MDSSPKLDERGLPDGYAFREGLETTPRQVKKMLVEGEDFVLIDCRDQREYDTAHIEGAKLLPIKEAERRRDELEALRDRKLVIHCHSGGRSMRMTQMLRQAGFTDVTSMAGGIDLWAVDIDTTVPRY